MFSAKVVAQLLHKRRNHHERVIVYVPGELSLGAEEERQLNDMQTEYFERQASARLDPIGYHEEFGY